MTLLYEDDNQELSFDTDLQAFKIVRKSNPSLINYYFPENVSKTTEDIENPLHLAMRQHLININWWS